VFHPGTLFQYETPGADAASSLMRFIMNPEFRAETGPRRRPLTISGISQALRLACRLLSHGARRGNGMGWLDAHEFYVMDIVARDRVDELRAAIDVATVHTERTAEPAPVIPDQRHRATASVGVCPRALARASR
jgi:hypothetical protein